MAVHNFLVSNLGWETTSETDPHLEKKKNLNSKLKQSQLRNNFLQFSLIVE